MLAKLAILIILVAVAIYFLPQLASIQVKPEFKEEKLKPTIVPPSPLEYPNLRWNHMAITVFVDSRTAEKDSFPLDVRLALEMWNEVTKGTISFVVVDSREADITVTWVDKLKSGSLDAAGNADIKFYNQTNFKILNKAEVHLLNKLDGKELTDFDMINLAVHEIGHSLGLSHNDAEDSIMNPTLKIPSKDIKNITQQEIQSLLDTYKLASKPDLYVSPNSTVTKIADKQLFKERYYMNAAVTLENIGIVGSNNATMVIKADGIIVREDNLPEIPIGAVFTRTYINLPVSANYSIVEIVIDPENIIDEIDEQNNILVLKV